VVGDSGENFSHAGSGGIGHGDQICEFLPRLA
jgi:hypothetical protein